MSRRTRVPVVIATSGVTRIVNPVVIATTALSTLALGGVASAHVTVHGEDATQGGYTKLTFRVPTEEADDTVKVQVTFPASTPVASVATRPKAGWTVSTTMQHLATPLTDDDGNTTSDVVGSITWTAAKGTGIPPEQFDEFEVSAGPLPDVASISFPTLQTYADGTVVSWIEPTPAGGEEPDHPVPTVTLAAAGGDGGAAEVAAGPSAAAVTTPAPAGSTGPAAVSVTASGGGGFATKDDADTGKTLGAVGIGVGALGLLVGAAGLLRGRRTPSAARTD